VNTINHPARRKAACLQSMYQAKVRHKFLVLFLVIRHRVKRRRVKDDPVANMLRQMA
jgi:hypothetical protein